MQNSYDDYINLQKFFTSIEQLKENFGSTEVMINLITDSETVNLCLIASM